MLRSDPDGTSSSQAPNSANDTARSSPASTSTSSSNYSSDDSGDQAVRVNATEQDIWDQIQSDIAQYEEQYADDVKDAAKDFAQMEIDADKKGELTSIVTAQNLGYALVSGSTNVAIDATIPKSGDPLQDTMNRTLHGLNEMSSLDFTLSGACERIKEVAKTMTGNFMENLDTIGQQIRDFRPL